MKLVILAALGCGNLALAGCATTASVTAPAATATVSTSVSSAITVGYSALCVGSSSSPSILTTIQTLLLNPQRQTDVASLQQICADGLPTDAITATIDGLNVYTLLKRDFPQLGLR